MSLFRRRRSEKPDPRPVYDDILFNEWPDDDPYGYEVTELRNKLRNATADDFRPHRPR